MAEITYLMDADPPGTNAFFATAKGFFAANRSTVVDAPAGGSTLEDVFDDLRRRAAAGPSGVFDVINLVSHATGFSSLMFGLTRPERGRILTAARLTNAVAAAATGAPLLRKLGPPAVTASTHVRLYGCDVGKDAALLRDLGLMFGEPADIAAPLRVAVFRQTGGVFVHRLARTWALPWPTDVSKTPAAGWTAVRATFLAKAELVFGAVAAQRSPGDLFAADPVKASLAAAAAGATAATVPSFFFHEYFELPIPAGEADPQAFVNGVRTQTSAVVTGPEISDLTVPAKVGPPDFTDRTDPRLWVAHLAVLALVIDGPASLNDSGQFRTVRIAPAAAPTGGPRPLPDGGAPPPVLPPAHSLWDQATEEFLAGGGAQSDLDTVVAGLLDPAAAPDFEGDLAEPELPVLVAADDPEALPEEVEA